MQCLMLNSLNSESVQAPTQDSVIIIVCGGGVQYKLQGSEPSRIMIQWPEDSYDSSESSGD